MASATTDRRMGLTGDKGIKAPVRVATTANIVLSGEQTIDGVAVYAIGLTGYPDRVLVCNQSNPVENGIWDVSTGSWTRSIDCDGNLDLVTGTGVLPTAGSQANKYFIVTSPNPIKPGTSAITFVSTVAGLTALASSSGSSLVGHLQSGVGAVPETLQQALRNIQAWMVNVMDAPYYALGDGATDDTTAFTNAGATGLPVYVPSNLTYKVTTAVPGQFFSFGYPQFTGGGSVPNLSVLRKNGSASVPVSVGSGPYWAFGDSFTVGQGATATHNAYAYRIAQKTGLTLSNYGQSGKASWRATYELFNKPLNAADAVNKTSGLATWMAQFNDVYRGGTNTKTVTKVKGNLRAFLSGLFAKTAVGANVSAVPTGTWAAIGAGFAGGTRAERSLAQQGLYTVQNGSTLTQAFTGDNLVVHTLATDGVNQLSGSFTVAVDGVTLATYNGNGVSDGISDGAYNNQITYDAVVLTGLGTGAHSCVITAIADATHPVYIDTFETMLSPTLAMSVVVAEGAFQDANGWSQGGGIWSQKAMELTTRGVNEVVGEFFGYPVAVAKINDYFNTSVGLYTDHNHPNDLGHGQIAAAFLNSMALKQSVVTCSLYQTAVTSLANGAPTAVVWDTEQADDNAMHDPAVNPSRITVPFSGLYMVFGSVGFAANVTGVREVFVAKNGNMTFHYGAGGLPSTGGNECVFPFSTMIPLVAGDYIEITAVQNSGGALNTYVGTFATNVTATLIR